ncbi:hypothetical protein DFH11DRAFT_1096304 [Phellopilus nigrolimitatus]|nr:hypothetical protein DFH11DRAFT_1096304 [Phellopilus nigrolimitatus]
MDTIFGRKKPRPRQTSASTDLSERSVPYDKLGPATKSPIPVGTVSQGLRTSAASSSISAPMTNPTLTSDGTELNYYAIQRSRSERERLYNPSSRTLPKSPLMSASNSTATLSSEPSSSSSSSFTTVTNSNRVRRSEASSSGRRSPSMSDFGNYPPSSPPSSV